MEGRLTNRKQRSKGWIWIALLGLVLVGAACAQAPQAGGKSSQGSAGDTTGSGSGPGGEGTVVYVDEIELLLMESFPIQVSVVVRGNLANGCVVLDGITAERTGDGFALQTAAHKEGEFCTQALVPFEERVSLEVRGLKAGTYAVTAGEASAEFTFTVDNG
jgi:inhibitor of cysteine peptidase